MHADVSIGGHTAIPKWTVEWWEILTKYIFCEEEEMLSFFLRNDRFMLRKSYDKYN